MANVRWFNEGLRQIDDNGWPTNVYAVLTTKTCDQFADSDTLVTGVSMLSEITGTGYDRKQLAKPASTGRGQRVWPNAVWSTGVNTNWQNPPAFLFISVASGTAGIAFFVANLNDGGAAVTMNQAGVTLTVPVTTNYPATV